jgi:hypothetical protein
MTNDPVIFALGVALGIASAYVLINVFHQCSYGFRRWWRKVMCNMGSHAPTGTFEPAFGGRNVQRCLYCDTIVYEVQVTKNQVRRKQ